MSTDIDRMLAQIRARPKTSILVAGLLAFATWTTVAGVQGGKHSYSASVVDVATEAPTDAAARPSLDVSNPQVGNVFFVQDHAYTDEVYETIKTSGIDQWPAQTTSDNPDKSYHLSRPFACKVTKIGDDGFYKCSVNSSGMLNVQSVWTNHLLSAEDAEHMAPGTVVHHEEPQPAHLPNWLRMRSGALVYLGDDGGGSSSSSVCDSVTDFHSNGGSDSGGCQRHNRGKVVKIVSVEDDYSFDGKTNIPIIKIAALNNGWSGYTSSSVNIKPIIPVGAVLYVEKPMGNAEPHLRYAESSNLTDGPRLEAGTRVVVRRQYPDTNDYDLKVQVVSGSLSGNLGYVLSDELNAPGNLPLTMTK